MRIIKSFVTAVVFLLAFESLTSAEMTVMSLQERMRRSEVVALAKILKTQYTDVNEFGFGSWMAECLVERYFKPEKFINVNTVKDNKSALIYIAFSRVPVPSHRQPPVELSEGKEYLLFLKEDKTLAKGGEIVYKMIAPRGGAFEAGQDYFVHDEQNPEYPQAVQMSFEAIVQRVTQKNPVPPQPPEQLNKIAQPLTLTIQADKEVYEVGEEIWIDFKFKNVSEKPIELLILVTEFPQYHDFEFFDSTGNRISSGGPESEAEELRRIIKREEIMPDQEFVSKVPLHKWKLAGLGHPYTDIGSEARKIFVKGIYFTPVGIGFANMDKLFFGTLTSDTIIIEIIEKGRAGLPQKDGEIDIHGQLDRELSEDELRMKERLIALSRGEGDVADLRVEVMDGNPMTLTGMRIYNIADGKIVSQEWASIGSPEKRGERAVTDEEIRRLLQTLIEHQYWTFQGTQFIPDAPGFMVRFHYKDLSPVEYRCDAHEYEPSAQLSVIRSLWLDFVSSVSTTLKVEKPKG